MKIMIIGYSGSGKSTLSKRLSTFYNTPLLYMDRLQFEANWRMRDPKARDEDLLTFLESHNTWVIDGHYSTSHFDLRIKRSDAIYILNFSRWTCLKQVIKRYVTYRKQTRESIADGCIEKLDFQFLWWVMYKGRPKKRQRLYQEIIKDYPDKTFSFKRLRQLNKHLDEIGIT